MGGNVKIMQTKLLLLAALFFVFPFGASASDTTVYYATTTPLSISVVEGDVIDVTVSGGIQGNGWNTTHTISQDGVVMDSRYQHQDGTGATRGDAWSLQYSAIATTTGSLSLALGGGYNSFSMIARVITPSSGGGSAATTTVELPASANAANNMLTFFLAFAIFVISALFVMYLVKRFTD